VIFKLNLKNNQSLPIFISDEELLEKDIVNCHSIVKELDSWGYDVSSFVFKENPSDETIDLRTVEFNMEALNQYVLEKTGYEICSFSFPEPGSYDYLMAAISQKQTSPNLYIKHLEIVEEQRHNDDDGCDPYSDDPDPYEPCEYDSPYPYDDY
jgi:hypothetical protein